MKRRVRAPNTVVSESMVDYRGAKEPRLSLPSTPTGIGKFVELSVEANERLKLEKASLVFSDFSLSIEGKLRGSQLIEILKVLGGSAC